MMRIRRRERGFDLDGIAVLHEAPPEGAPQSIEFPVIGHQRLGDGSLILGRRPLVVWR